MVIVRNNKRIGITLLRRVVFSVFLFAGALMFAAPQAQAGSWGEAIAAAQMKFTMETIRRQIEGALLGTLKIAAVQVLNSQVGQLISGGVSGQPLFITDYNEFLYQRPREETNLYMNDFFTMTTRGRSSRANYIGAGNQPGIGRNYSAYLESVGRQSSVDSGRIQTYNLDEYTASPDQMFAEGDFRAFNAFFSNPANNPYGYALQSERVYQNKLAQEQQAAAIEAQSSGFISARQGGRIVTPAGSIEAALNNIQDIPNKIIAAASNPGELLSGVVSGVANRMVTALIQTGIGMVESNIQRAVDSVDRAVMGSAGGALRTLGPGGTFYPGVSQRTNINTSSGYIAPPFQDPDKKVQATKYIDPDGRSVIPPADWTNEAKVIKIR